MQEGVSVMLNAIIQYGFAGFAAVLLVIIVWLIRNLLCVLKQNNEIITANTNAIQSLEARTADEILLIRAVHDKLLSRPCIAEGER